MSGQPVGGGGVLVVRWWYFLQDPAAYLALCRGCPLSPSARVVVCPAGTLAVLEDESTSVDQLASRGVVSRTTGREWTAGKI